uniref:GLTSCR protein conserved domain-containing protein n=1 Tax=Ciona savignyi TaxID=51511 RepID=H2YB59_CIOSA
MPEIAQKDFDRSEPLFSSHSTYLVKKVDRMLAKYNILSLREDARTCCSADLVMLERSFLQHERAQLAKLKQEVNENPTVLKHYIPPTSENQEVLSFLRGECEPSGDELDNSRLRSESEDSQICSNSYVYNSNYVKTFSEKPSALYEPVECEVVSFDHQQDSLLQEAVDSILY